MFDDSAAGGFFNENASFEGKSSPGQKKTGDPKRVQNIMPVSVRQILSSPEGGLRVGSFDVYLVTIVGIVRAVETTSVKITYTVEDNTGCIDGVHWIDGQDENGAAAQPQVVENTYCRLSGTIKFHSEKHFIMAFSIQQIDDFNEITTHFLEVALFSKRAETNSAIGGVIDSTMDQTSHNGNGNNLSNSLMVIGGKGGSLSNIQIQLLRAIQCCGLANGINRDVLIQQLKNSASRGEICADLEFLCQEGHVYTTIDDFHYRTTDTD